MHSNPSPSAERTFLKITVINMTAVGKTAILTGGGGIWEQLPPITLVKAYVRHFFIKHKIYMKTSNMKYE